ncbi:putative 3-demethylubiquinone-9 3-methyltransferase (glyoxalase superfamily) [Streptomyces sp. 1114.5]|uniref:VOC family protein n=1 Tax=unclassified Streptomyces TaxID=2593676 RepID=UPI000BDAB768|nr:MULTISPECIES: VOC family protein [unclassified Streptomyces]RKT08787.1 putative 3-demethylubiquinone-9 3-methyltransferase (glyoxalase superfamily) [Streptomyces sp. 1114.5]SOB79050.1 Glyoxalase superfamily enzyme, possibly 3-demethylubiquinone-9 3-methyltransferase [Streptomyces sp. 1331.2]
MQKIATFLWYDDRAEEAAAFYTSLFPDSRITRVTRYGEAGPGVPGSVMTVDFELAGREYVALNGGPEFTFTEAVSLQVECDDQEEVDRLWAALTADGGQEGPCGWLKDRFGLSWQITPRVLLDLVGGEDRAKADRVMATMLRMQKLDIQPLLDAAEG